jgi:hypothetical protein
VSIPTPVSVGSSRNARVKIVFLAKLQSCIEMADAEGDGSIETQEARSLTLIALEIACLTSP